MVPSDQAAEGTAVSDPQESHSAGRFWLACLVGREHYLVEVPVIHEIIRVPDVTNIPRSPNWLKGICSLRGVVIAVIDVAARLSINGGPSSVKNRVVIVSTSKGIGGLLVDRVLGLIEIDDGQIEEPPPLLAASHRKFIRGIVHRQQQAYALLDLEHVLSIRAAQEVQAC